MNIGTNIFNIRTSKGIKQSEMAEKLGLEQSGYSRIEKRGNKISYDAIEKIAEILEVTPSKLLNLDVQIEEEKEKVISAHKIEIAMKDQVISDLGKIIKMTEEVLEDFCDMIEHEVRMSYEHILTTELGVEEEELIWEDGTPSGGFDFNVSEEQQTIAFHNYIFKDSIIYQYFSGGLYRHSKDSFNVISEFLKFFKSYNPTKPKSRLNNPEISYIPSNNSVSVNNNLESHLQNSLSWAYDRIKDKERIVKISDDILNNIVYSIDNAIEPILLEIWQGLGEERKSIGSADVRFNGKSMGISLNNYFEKQLAFLESRVRYDLVRIRFSFEDANIIIQKIYESEWVNHYLALLGDTLIFELCKHNEILERSKYLIHFQNYNNLEKIQAEKSKPQDVPF